MRIHRHMLRVILILVALGLPASEGVHASRAAKTKKAENKEAKAAEGEPKEGEGTEEAEAVPTQYKLGRALDGHFDRHTLRSAKNCVSYRYPIKNIVKTLNLDRPWLVQMSCAVEFGSESGMAEISSKRIACQTEILKVIERFTPLELISSGGKMRLKEAIAAGINQHLTTARVRQVYLTDFIVLQGE